MLQKWDFSATNKTAKVETTKALVDWDPSRQTPLRAGTAEQQQKVWFVTSRPRPSPLDWPLDAHQYVHSQMGDTRENILTHYKVNLSGRRA